ncbi:MAG: AI-2E family transporter [Alphaproteobacteria bacterium]|nr:AI-2E family transporter [Alphaproteobacteria bacterium]
MSQNRYWLIALAVFAALLWLLKPMLLPFIAGFAIAYFLNPVVDGLTRHKVPRWLGTFFVLFGFVVAVVMVFLMIAPLLQEQIGALIDAVPGYIETLRAHLIPSAERWLRRLSPGNVENIRAAAGQVAGNAAGWAGKLLQGLISESAALFNILALIIITPVVAFFILRDWPKLTHNVDVLLPRKYIGLIHEVLAEINRTLSGFIRGQALVCLCLAVIYSAGLSLAGIKYGVTIGIIAGVLSFVPYVGSTFVLASGLILSFVQYGDFFHVAMALLVFLIGQSLEGYVLTPKLVGGRVGLHPVWILFALFAGGSLLGFVGVLIAVPVAAIAGVLIRFAIRRYKKSGFYKHD